MSFKYNPRNDPNPKITEEVVEKLLKDYTKQQLKNIALLLYSSINYENQDEYNPENDPYPRTTHHAVFGVWDDDNMEINEKIASLLLKSVDEGGVTAPKPGEEKIYNAVRKLWDYVDTMPMRKNIALLFSKSVKEGNLIDGKNLPTISFPEQKNPKKLTAEEERLRAEWSLGLGNDVSSTEIMKEFRLK